MAENNVGRRGLFHLICPYQSVLKGSQGRGTSQLMQRPWGKATPRGLLSLLSCRAQDYQPRGGTALPVSRRPRKGTQSLPMCLSSGDISSFEVPSSKNDSSSCRVGVRLAITLGEMCLSGTHNKHPQITPSTLDGLAHENTFKGTGLMVFCGLRLVFCLYRRSQHSLSSWSDGGFWTAGLLLPHIPGTWA